MQQLEDSNLYEQIRQDYSEAITIIEELKGEQEA